MMPSISLRKNFGYFTSYFPFIIWLFEIAENHCMWIIWPWDNKLWIFYFAFFVTFSYRWIINLNQFSNPLIDRKNAFDWRLCTWWKNGKIIINQLHKDLIESGINNLAIKCWILMNLIVQVIIRKYSRISQSKI
jgi:hypothetical protein